MEEEYIWKSPKEVRYQEFVSILSIGMGFTELGEKKDGWYYSVSADEFSKGDFENLGGLGLTAYLSKKQAKALGKRFNLDDLPVVVE